MTSQKLDEEAIFKVAREIKPPDAQAVYLQQVCGDDSDLHNRLVALLSVQAKQPDFLESPAAAIVTVDQPGIAQRKIPSSRLNQPSYPRMEIIPKC